MTAVLNARACLRPAVRYMLFMERDTGFEPVPPAWKAEMLAITPIPHMPTLIVGKNEMRTGFFVSFFIGNSAGTLNNISARNMYH